MVSWLFIGFLITTYDHYGLYSSFSSGPNESYSYLKSLIFNMTAAFIGSAMGGPFLIFYVNEKLRNKAYGYSLLAVAVSFIIVVSFITVVLGFWLIKTETGHWPFIEKTASEAYYAYLVNPIHAKNILVWSIVTIMTQFSLQINDKFGGLLWDFIRGKYQIPRSELRVFMFLDLIDSTTMAEKLGNKDYYNLLRDFYADITNDIIYNRGQIYQYVGDEVVVSWKYEEGVVDHQCIKCYFDVRERIALLEDKYRNKYGLIPDFKAALHYGHVTAGEIGIIKKDITYSGDVLNTTSRILSKCREYEEKLLVSGQLYKSFSTWQDAFSFSKMGEELLRGKAEKVEMYAVAALANSDAMTASHGITN